MHPGIAEMIGLASAKGTSKSGSRPGRTGSSMFKDHARILLQAMVWEQVLAVLRVPGKGAISHPHSPGIGHRESQLALRGRQRWTPNPGERGSSLQHWRSPLLEPWVRPPMLPIPLPTIWARRVRPSSVTCGWRSAPKDGSATAPEQVRADRQHPAALVTSGAAWLTS